MIFWRSNWVLLFNWQSFFERLQSQRFLFVWCFWKINVGVVWSVYLIWQFNILECFDRRLFSSLFLFSSWFFWSNIHECFTLSVQLFQSINSFALQFVKVMSFICSLILFAFFFWVYRCLNWNFLGVDIWRTKSVLINDYFFFFFIILVF